MTPALELRGLSVRHGDVQALEGIDLAVEPGCLCVLLGPSGCGKSTALRAIAGLDHPSAGEVRIDGRRVDDLDPAARDVAMVFQSYALYPHMTVRGNLAFPLAMRGTPKAEAARRIEEAARLLAIDRLLDRRPRQLSGGERQRVAIGRAIVRDPRLFLLDEPLSNLDARLRTEMRVEIARLHRRLGRAMVYVTHDQVEALTLGERIVVLRAGRVEQIGTPEDVYERPATPFVASFVGTPGMNLVEGKVEGGRFAGGGLSIGVAAPDGPVELGFRPDRARLAGEHGRGVVELVENLGADRHAHVRLEGGAAVVVRLDPADRPRVDEAVGVAIDPAGVHLFSGGRRVR